MQRDDWCRVKKIPLLIGGATTSRVHTAVKIAPHYEGPVVYVPDASRSVGVCSELLSDERAARYIAEVNADYARVRELHANKKQTPLVTLAAARANKTAVDWAAYTPPAPRFIGRREFRNYDLNELVACIDWGPFFQTWDLAGRFPDILRDEIVGEQAQRVFSDGKRLLHRAIEGRWLQAAGVIALLPANTVDDDTIEVYTDESRSEVALRWSPLRLQTERPVIDGPDGKKVSRPNRCLADFIAPKGVKPDYIGAFAVTAGLGVEKKEKQFVDDLDDYSAIMLKSLADRLAEAFAERLHQRVRAEFWGYAAGEQLGNDELIAEKYRGIRPAPGYPACPEHGVKRELFRVLQAEDIGMALTDSMAMSPAASVCGFYLAHPDALYFNVGRIGDDQLEDWARRQGVDVTTAKRRLAPSL
ncbi:MAG TPA: vitamin B12 dependent-methionine synthase activation domain-containing protein, partial [Rubrivivax sp.]|nr:vitamin B12 dependent-methionine synthase activation domain-containing protein [Rubrivivax sp.]